MEDLLGGRAFSRIWVEHLGDKGASLMAEVGGNAVLVVLDALVGLLQTLCLKGRPANQQCVAGRGEEGDDYDIAPLVAPATASLRRCWHTYRTHPMDQTSTS